jgi:uncharacterized protein YyaL (SSP411 family)
MRSAKENQPSQQEEFNATFAHLPPKETKKTGNHLSGQASVYLKQHAFNPVDWYPYDPQALTLAKTQDKPIFLSIGYSACHWCHVMEKEVFENESIAEYLNAHFVCIKIDREERPDLDHVYMQAVIRLTGSGGWPLSVFLTPDGRPFFGGTYFPPEHFVRITSTIADAYQNHRSDIESTAALLSQPSQRAQTTEKKIALEAFSELTQAVRRVFDPRWGGLQGRMKFPQPIIWHSLLRLYRKNGDPDLADMVKITLENMASGGIHDQLAGGFHRYTTEPTWLIPHFEKMLYDNALLADLYLEAYAVFDRPGFRRVAERTLDFLLDEMLTPEGGLAASMDADAAGEEGLYYVWTPDEIIDRIGPEDGPLVAALLGVDPSGNFEGKSVLTRKRDVNELARTYNKPAAVIERRYQKHRPTLLKARRERQAPARDPKIIAAWNGMALSALARGYRLLGHKRYLKSAQKLADYLLAVHVKDGKVARVSYQGRAEHAGMLDDHAWLVQGLVDLYQADFDQAYVSAAQTITARTLRDFSHPGGGWYLNTQSTILGRPLEISDGVRGSGNSTFIKAITALGTLTGDVEYLNAAQKALAAFSGQMLSAHLDMTGWYDAALHATGPTYQVVLAGDKSAPGTQDLMRLINRRLPSYVVMALVPAKGAGPKTLSTLPALAGKFAHLGKATAFVCTKGSCQRPTQKKKELESQLWKDWKY